VTKITLSGRGMSKILRLEERSCSQGTARGLCVWSGMRDERMVGNVRSNQVKDI